MESLLSDMANAEPPLVELLANDISGSCLESSVDVVMATFVNSIREHDLMEATQTIRSMLANEDLKRLRLHSRGPAAWLWKVVLDSQVTH